LSQAEVPLASPSVWGDAKYFSKVCRSRHSAHAEFGVPLLFEILALIDQQRRTLAKPVAHNPKDKLDKTRATVVFKPGKPEKISASRYSTTGC
jgi:hypothetical protein